MAELYLFSDASRIFRFSPSVLNKIFQGQVYEACNIKRSELNLTNSTLKNQVTFTLPVSNTFAKELLNVPLESPMLVVIFRNNSPFWQGSVSSVKLSDKEIQIVCNSDDSVETTSKRGVVFAYQCSNTPFSPECGLNKANFSYSIPVTFSSGFLEISTSGLVPGKFNNGILQVATEQRRVLSNTETSILVSYPFSSNYSGTATITEICNLLFSSCQKFGNGDRFMGFPFIPIKNPMEKEGLL